MIFLLDTNAFSDLMRKHSRVEGRMSSLPAADRVVICPVVRGEILYGIEQLPQSRRRQSLERQAAPLFAIIRLDNLSGLRKRPGQKGDIIVLFRCSVEFKGDSFHVPHSMTSERCLSHAAIKADTTD